MISKYALVPMLLFSFYSNADVASDIQHAISENLKYIQSEDLENAMATLHSQSPSYLTTQQMLQQLFPAYEVKYELLEYNFVGSDNEYAYAKVLQRTTKVSGPAFRNNEIEALQVFKKENGKWKLWTQANLSIEFE